MFMALTEVLDHKTLSMPGFHTQPGGTKWQEMFKESKNAKKIPIIRNI